MGEKMTRSCPQCTEAWMTASGISCIIHSGMPRHEQFLSSNIVMRVHSGAANRLTEVQHIGEVEMLIVIEGSERVGSHWCHQCQSAYLQYEHTCWLSPDDFRIKNISATNTIVWISCSLLISCVCDDWLCPEGPIRLVFIIQGELGFH